MKKLICLLLAVMMVMAMTACGDENKKPYEEAVAAYNNGYYEEAANKLAALGDYEDAAAMLASITAEKSGVTTTVTAADGEVTTTTEYVFKDGNLIKENITYGFVWDNDKWGTNMFMHPYHGNLYYNAARSNGYNYWQSGLFALAGSAMWEVLMENEHPSINDIITTPIGEHSMSIFSK